MHHAKEIQDLTLKHEIIIQNHIRHLEESLLKRGERLERNLKAAQDSLEARLRDGKVVEEALSMLRNELKSAQGTCDSVEKSNEDFGACLRSLRYVEKSCVEEQT
jgi:septation ring formation regulator EzrA